MFETCCIEWDGPQADAPTSVDVHHVCIRNAGHLGPCWCVCGAEQIPQRLQYRDVG